MLRTQASRSCPITASSQTQGERRLHRLEIRRAGQRRGQQFLADDAAGAPPVDQQPHRLLANMRDAIARPWKPRRARPLAARRTPCGAAAAISAGRIGTAASRSDGWRSLQGRARLFPDADAGHAARHIDLGRGGVQTRRRIACSCKLLSGWPGVQAMKPAARNTRSMSAHVLLALVVLRHVLRITGRALACIPLPVLGAAAQPVAEHAMADRLGQSGPNTRRFTRGEASCRQRCGCQDGSRTRSS